MPYSDVGELPAYVKKLPANKQRQWMHIFNSCLSDGKSESSCFAVANGVAKKEVGDEFVIEGEIAPDADVERATKDYQYVDSYEYERRQLSQTDAGYNPVGGDGTKACSNCMFFVSPARCTVVSGVIASNGLSNQWRAVAPYEEKPIPVFIVGSDLGNGKATSDVAQAEAAPAPSSLRAKLASLFGLTPKATPTADEAVKDTRALAVIKQSDGKLRWFARYSNAWEDRDHEILTEEAHKDYIKWAYDTGTFPELWLWHTGGTRIGEADWLDFSNGFAHASGLIDDGRESVIDALSTKDIGVSHGFLSLQQGKYVSRYRTYEISVLPRERAAVETSGFNVLDTTKENVMAFTPEKRKWLVEALGADAVAGLEKSTDAMAEQLQALGTEYKETEEAKVEVAVSTADAVKALGEQVAQITQGMATLATAIGAIKATADEAKTEAAKSKDELEEDTLITKLAKAINAGSITRPSQSSANVQGEKEGGAAPVPDFFSTMIAEQLGSVTKAAGSGGIGTAAAGSVTVAAGSDGVQEVRD